MTDHTGLKISVVICTYNRAELLRQCLEGLFGQDSLECAEVLVVDNNCTDHTAQVVEAFVVNFPHLRLVREENAGLSHARNRGLDEARADIIAYLDDDAIPDPGWVRAMLGAFEATGADSVGGKIVPYWSGKKPWWVSTGLYPLVCEIDLGDGTVISESFHPFGGNMAFRTELLKELGGFDVRLGVTSESRSNNLSYLGEEIQVALKISARGGKIAYCGGAAIRHLTHGRMRTFKGLKARAAEAGRTDALLGSDNADPAAWEDEWVWAVGCMISSMLRFYIRDGLVFYLRSVGCRAKLEQSASISGKRFSAGAALTGGMVRLKKGLLGIARRTLIGTPMKPDFGGRAQRGAE